MLNEDPALFDFPRPVRVLTGVELLGRYFLLLRFAGDLDRILDLESAMVGAEFEPLLVSYASFKLMAIDHGEALVWSTGARVEAEALYRDSKPAVP
ncbi:DUF2442 domain-containing protein [Nocardioides halotolerans]|uniref:DUF2442 domain-containing protein n=1 Tax=Nocardioides halotolerans TaxID=433660 RepID=UPI0012FAB862|nr:DUF2442 domain-containing protein [Nocardioides halotolerans]